MDRWCKKPVGEMAEVYGEITSFQAKISGEMQVNDVPLAPWVDLNAIKGGDQEPLEVVVECPTGKSKRGWNYTAQALQAIVGEVNANGLAGFLGHQRPENIDSEFLAPATHWVGAKWDAEAPVKDQSGNVIGKGVAYFRGVVDKAQGDLKRWIKSKVIRTVSIFGMPKLQKVAGETRVIDYKPLSIDWTPLGRNGMPTRIVATGEIDVIGEFSQGGEQTVNWKELCAKLKAMLQSGEITTQQICGEMGWSAEKLARVLDEDWLNKVTGEMVVMGEIRKTVTAEKPAEEIAKTFATLTKVKETLGVTGEMDAVAVAAEAAKAIGKLKKSQHAAIVDEALKEKVFGEMAQALISKMLNVTEGATKEQVAGEIDKLLADETIKATLASMHIDNPPPAGGSGSDKGTGSVRKRKSSI